MSCKWFCLSSNIDNTGKYAAVLQSYTAWILTWNMLIGQSVQIIEHENSKLKSEIHLENLPSHLLSADGNMTQPIKGENMKLPTGSLRCYSLAPLVVRKSLLGLFSRWQTESSSIPDGNVKYIPAICETFHLVCQSNFIVTFRSNESQLYYRHQHLLIAILCTSVETLHLMTAMWHFFNERINYPAHFINANQCSIQILRGYCRKHDKNVILLCN